MSTTLRVLLTRLLPEPALALMPHGCEVQYDAADQHVPAAHLRGGNACKGKGLFV
jgi:hypothetical protein